jgi:hypothetical protein
MTSTREPNEEDFELNEDDFDIPPLNTSNSYLFELKKAQQPSLPVKLSYLTAKTNNLSKDQIIGLKNRNNLLRNNLMTIMVDFINNLSIGCNEYPTCIKNKVNSVTVTINEIVANINQINEQIKQSSQNGGKRRKTRKKRAHKRTNKRK